MSPRSTSASSASAPPAARETPPLRTARGQLRLGPSAGGACVAATLSIDPREVTFERNIARRGLRGRLPRFGARRVAAKEVARKDLSERALEAFENEAALLASLNNGRCGSTAPGMTEESLFLVMEHCCPKALDNHLSEAPRTMEEFFRLSIELADAMSFVHTRKVACRRRRRGARPRP